MRSVGNRAALVVDLASLAIGGWGLWTNIHYELPHHLADAGHWQFLTNISLAYSLLVFALGFLAHALYSQPIFSLKNSLHPIALTMEMIVASVYWPLRLLFLHLLVDDVSRFTFPVQVDLAIHLFPVVALAADYILFMPPWTITTRSALLGCAGITVAYWFHLARLIDMSKGAMYPYQFLNVEDDTVRGSIFVIVGLVGFLMFLVARQLHGWIVPKQKLE